MLVFLIHVRDPQFYALPSKTRARNGRIRIMGFPPIGIMSLSAVLKQAGHECVMFDQANPETPDSVILDACPKWTSLAAEIIARRLPSARIIDLVAQPS